MIIFINFEVNDFFPEIVKNLRVADDQGMITPSQCRAARGLLSWNQLNLADRAGVSIMTVNQFEKEGSRPRRATLDVVRRAFEKAGVEFIEENGGGPGVRLRKSTKVRSRK